MSETLASRLSAFASDLTYARVPKFTREAAIWHIVDSLGVCVAGAAPGEESAEVVRRLVEKWQAPVGATVFGLGARCRPEASALLNGALIQALEMDDKHGSSLARPGSTVIPAALAVAEQHDLDMNDVLAAIVVGYEVMIRLGFVAGERFLERGYHTSALLGAFGAAATVGRLRGCRADQIQDALGIAGTMASGIQEATRTGSTSKILHGGWAAHVGIVATDLAMCGITGPATIFEGHYGFFLTHLSSVADDLDWRAPVDSLGVTWHLQETAFKPYPCCQILHAFVEAAKQLSAQMARAGCHPKEITRICCRVGEPGLTLVTEPKDRKAAPEHPHEARFSLPFVVATTLLHGDIDVESFRGDRLRDREIRRMAGLVVSEDDPESDYPLHCPAVMEIHAGEKVFRCRVPFHPGCPEAPLSTDDVLDKFARNTRWLLGDGARKVGESLAATLENESVQDVVKRLTP
ncbi:MAG: MmgE/PrpD family protein [Candidatus Rokuibacteriota bacterium]